MKTTLLMCSLLLATTLTASANEKELLKSCSTVLVMPSTINGMPTKIDVYKTNNSLMATVTQDVDGEQISYDDEAQVEELPVKAGLTSDPDQEVEGLNLAEKLIAHALMVTEDPITEGVLSAGLDLRKVRSAKIYTIGESTHMGLSAIVEAKDESGKDLGSFFGGFLVTPCK